MDFTWLGIQICICWSQMSLKKSCGVDQTTSQYLVWPPFVSPLHRVDQAVDCGLLSHSSSIAARNRWILAGTGTCCRTHRSRASQMCSVGDMSGEYAGHGRTGTFSTYRNCVQILATWSRALSCWNMRWWQWINGTTMGLRILARYLCAFKLQSIKCYVRCP